MPKPATPPPLPPQIPQEPTPESSDPDDAEPPGLVEDPPPVSGKNRTGLIAVCIVSGLAFVIGLSVIAIVLVTQLVPTSPTKPSNVSAGTSTQKPLPQHQPTFTGPGMEAEDIFAFSGLGAFVCAGFMFLLIGMLV